MKTVFDKATRDELIGRINTLDENSTAQWGKMNINQMLNHCTKWDEWVSEKKKNKQFFIGRLFGKKALSNLLKDEKPMPHSVPTIPQLRITNLEHCDVSDEKTKWIEQIEAFSHFSNDDFVHTFFGKMTKEQIGYLAYKHADHHLRQFNS